MEKNEKQEYNANSHVTSPTKVSRSNHENLEGKTNDYVTETGDDDEEIVQECRLVNDINRELLPPKLFYFFFFAANGTLVPYLILFFKQIGLSPSQVGIVIGFKPFISFICSPLWGYIADKTNKTRLIFVISLIAYVSGYFAYSFAPTKHVCVVKSNSTKHAETMIHNPHIHTRYTDENSDFNIGIYDQGIKNQELINRKENNQLIDKSFKIKKKRNVIAHLDSYYRRKVVPAKDEKIKELVRKSDIPTTVENHRKIPYDSFYPAELSSSLFQIPVSAIDFLSFKQAKPKTAVPKPALKHKDRLIDTPIIINATNEKVANYELAVPISIAKSWTKPLSTKNGPWTVCAAAKANTIDDIFFSQAINGQVNMKAIFSYLLVVTLIATLFSCPLITIVDTATIRKLKETNETHKYGKQRLWGSLGWGISSFGVGAIISTLPLCPGINNEVNYYPAFYIFAVLLVIALLIGLRLQFSDNRIEDREYDSVITRAQQIKNGLKLLKDPIYFSFIFTAFYIGVTMSIIKTFLFWHLKDLGGTQMLFSIISAVNCVAEVFVYFVSSTFIRRVGHIRVLYTALVCYSLRLFYYGLLTNPWYVLAAEPLSGITTAAAWASMTSFVGLNANLESVTTLQGILHGVHWGLGHGCGELIGGFMVSWIGAAMTFNVFGVITIIELLLFMLINRLASKPVDSNDSEQSSLQDILDIDKDKNP